MQSWGLILMARGKAHKMLVSTSGGQGQTQEPQAELGAGGEGRLPSSYPRGPPQCCLQ